jgi:signal transduction histidine kinase
LLAHLPPLADLIEQALGTGAALVRRVLAVPPAPGLPTHLGVGVSPLADGTGRLQGVICLFSDLSDIVDLEEQVRLKDSLSRLGELTAGLAHEFRNGLSTIHGYARLMDPDRLPESYRPCLAGIRAETDTLGEVVTNFLGFARPAELALAPVDLGAVARRLAEDARGEASGGHIQVAGDFGLVEGDEVLLRQAIDNLLRNAIEACREASLVASIRIDGHRDDARRVVRVTVSDNGPGFDPQMMPRLFKPFATSRRAGTGLGLALVQKIIVSHNGRVTASRAPDGGAMVQIELPLSAAERVSGL